MTLTVVIPVCDDYARWLAGCVESIWRQRTESALAVARRRQRLVAARLPALPDGVEVERHPAAA